MDFLWIRHLYLFGKYTSDTLIQSPSSTPWKLQKKFCASKTEPSLARARAWFGSSSSALQSRATSQQLLIEEEHVMASLEPMSFLIKISWQAQYLVKFKGHFFVAGAVFGEIWKDRRSAKCCIFQYTGVP